MNARFLLFAGIGLIGCSATHAGIATTDVVNAQMDTRTYEIEVISELPYCYPEAALYQVAWGGGIGCYADYYQGSNTTYIASGWTSEGGIGTLLNPGSPAPWYSGTFFPTNLTSSVTWSWDSYYLLSIATSGQGGVSMTPEASGWYLEGSSVTLQTLPEYGWLFTGWSGGLSGGPAETSKVHLVTAPVDAVAYFSDDPDGDGLANTNEWAAGADPWLADTDADGFGDRLEFDHGWNPAVSDAWAVDYIQDHGETFGLYPSNAVLDVVLGEILLETAGGSAILNLQLEQSEDLSSWTNAGEAVEWVLPVDSAKQFFRVRSGQ